MKVPNENENDFNEIDFSNKIKPTARKYIETLDDMI